MADTLAERIHASHLAPFAADLLAFARPAIRLDHAPLDAEPPLGTSRFGGLPDVPSGFRWPRRHRPLAFLVQLDLASLASFPAAAALPADGLLSFFYDATGQPWGGRASEQKAFRVFHFGATAALQRRHPPAGTSPELLLPASDAVASHLDTLPAELPIWSERFDALEREPTDAYLDEVQWPDVPAHQVLGYPRPIQRDLWGAESEPRSPWASLLELDSHPALGVSWGDAGKLHWLLPRDDLAAGRFDRVHGQLQCC
ncbi:MAG: DUF1963 domain-containing protein [Acidimicrobiia bacterium]|nr:DUF1963 domain-containing protein [Acidimicrobiia bacterium]